MRKTYIDVLANWVVEKNNIGFELYLMTVTFNHLGGSVDKQVEQIHQELRWIQGKLVKRIHRRPRSSAAKDILPTGYFFPDYSGSGALIRNTPRRKIKINDGLHVHGVLASLCYGRMKEPLDQHFHSNPEVYRSAAIYDLNVKKVSTEMRDTASYAFKGMRHMNLSEDHLFAF